MNRRLLATAAVALGLVTVSLSLPARADPDTPAPATSPSAKPKKKPPHKAAAPTKPKPAATPKDAPKDAPADASKPKGPSSARDVVEHESRIEFDERMVHGQSAAGAIFLFQRTPSDLKSIIEVPDTFRPKTVEMLQPERGTP